MSRDCYQPPARSAVSGGPRSCSRLQKAARQQGRLFGIGLAVAVEPCVSNMGYLNLAFPPEMRTKKIGSVPYTNNLWPALWGLNGELSVSKYSLTEAGIWIEVSTIVRNRQ